MALDDKISYDFTAYNCDTLNASVCINLKIFDRQTRKMNSDGKVFLKSEEHQGRPQFSGSGTFDLSTYECTSVPEYAQNWYSDYIKTLQLPVNCDLFKVNYCIGYSEKEITRFTAGFFHEINIVDSKGKPLG